VSLHSCSQAGTAPLGQALSPMIPHRLILSDRPRRTDLAHYRTTAVVHPPELSCFWRIQSAAVSAERTASF